MFGGRRFRDRATAGAELAREFASQDLQDLLVLGLPRGGVIVARALALSLGLPFDLYAVRKLRAPQSAEYGIGAVAEDGEPWIDREAVARLGIPSSYLEAEVEAQRLEIERQLGLYRQDRPLSALEGRRIIVVDDGIATGATTLAGVVGLTTRKAAEVVVAAPVCSPSAVHHLRSEGCRLVVLDQPDDFFAVGQFYDRFEQVTDEQVIEALGS